MLENDLFRALFRLWSALGLEKGNSSFMITGVCEPVSQSP